MAITDKFTDFGMYKGDPQTGLSMSNFNQIREEMGEDWVKGYIRAMEIFAVDLADIIYSDKICGRRETHFKTSRLVEKYWDHNFELLKNLTSTVGNNALKKDGPKTG